jgi:hypothetical protein
MTAVTPTGRVVGEVTADAESTLMRQIANALLFFYPRLPETGVAPGAMWVDTNETVVPTGQLDLLIVAIGTFSAGEWEEMDGATTLPVALAQTMTVSGSGEQAGAQFTFSGTGVSHGMLRFGADGRYLGLVSNDTIRADVNVEAAGLVIPVTIIQTDTIRALR